MFTSPPEVKSTFQIGKFEFTQADITANSQSFRDYLPLSLGSKFVAQFLTGTFSMLDHFVNRSAYRACSFTTGDLTLQINCNQKFLLAAIFPEVSFAHREEKTIKNPLLPSWVAPHFSLSFRLQPLADFVNSWPRGWAVITLRSWGWQRKPPLPSAFGPALLAPFSERNVGTAGVESLQGGLPHHRVGSFWSSPLYPSRNHLYRAPTSTTGHELNRSSPHLESLVLLGGEVRRERAQPSECEHAPQHFETSPVLKRFLEKELY